MANYTTVLHLRSEQKPLEHRSALTPTTAKALLDAGYQRNDGAEWPLYLKQAETPR